MERSAPAGRRPRVVRTLVAGCIALAGIATASLPAQAQKISPMLVFGQEATPPTLDPHFSTSIATRNVAMHVFEQLLTRDENNGVIPELAESWEVSPDGLTYTFKIPCGVKFRDGKALTSADVKASFERY